MKEIISLWQYTRMVVLTAVSAACYVAVLLPFKVAVIIPGLTEVRPGAAVPLLLSMLFGPAAAFGAGIGNVIADILGGMVGPGSIFGFIGNFLYGFVPYALWRSLRGRARPGERGMQDWLLIGGINIIGCMTIGTVIGWGVDLLGLAPFAALGNIIVINNIIASCFLAIPLLALTYRRVEQAGLLWHDIMREEDQGTSRFRVLGIVLTVSGAVFAMAAANLISLGYLDGGFAASGFSDVKGSALMGAGVAPFMLILVAGCALL